MCIVLAPAVAAGIAIASTVASAAGAGLSAYGQYKASQAQQAQYNAEAKIAANNAKISQMAEADAQKRGGEADIKIRRDYAAKAGAQRASLAGTGVALDEGSALSVLEDTSIFEGIDSGRTRDNAEKEAWQARVQGQNYESSAAMSRAGAANQSPLLAASGTLLGGASDVADRWLKFRGT